MKSRISNALVIGLAATMFMVDDTEASAQDLCTKGSDAECARFGE